MFHDGIDPAAAAQVSAPQPQPLAEAAGFLRGVAGLPSLALRRAARGDGGVVLVVPGYLSSDLSTVALRGYLGSLGYRAHGWGFGANRGDVVADAARVADLARRYAQGSGRAVRIVGWSLGGVIGREAARAAPDAVRHVVTLGSPIVGGPKFTVAAASLRAQGWDLDRIAADVAARNAEPLPVPVTALYSRSDTVVAWQACLDPNPANDTRHVEVGGRHAELAFSAPVLRLVAQALSAGR